MRYSLCDSSSLFPLFCIAHFRLQTDDLLGVILQLFLRVPQRLLRILQLDLSRNQLMLQIVQLLLSRLRVLLHPVDLLFGLEIVIRDVELEKDMLHLRRLSAEAVHPVILGQLIVDIRSHFL